MVSSHSKRTVSETKYKLENRTFLLKHSSWESLNQLKMLIPIMGTDEQDLEAWEWPIDVPNLQSVDSMLPWTATNTAPHKTIN